MGGDGAQRAGKFATEFLARERQRATPTALHLDNPIPSVLIWHSLYQELGKQSWPRSRNLETPRTSVVERERSGRRIHMHFL